VKKQSPLIRKNISKITSLGYRIYPNDSQLYKKIGTYEVLITDLSHRSFFNFGFYAVYIVVWIKDSETDTILKEKFYTGMFFPSLKKINNYITMTIDKMENERRNQ
jgi:hypothetical protein